MEILKSILVGFFMLLGIASLIIGLAIAIVMYPIILTVIVYAGLLIVLTLICWILGDWVRGI